MQESNGVEKELKETPRDTNLIKEVKEEIKMEKPKRKSFFKYLTEDLLEDVDNPKSKNREEKTEKKISTREKIIKALDFTERVGKKAVTYGRKGYEKAKPVLATVGRTGVSVAKKIYKSEKPKLTRTGMFLLGVKKNSTGRDLFNRNFQPNRFKGKSQVPNPLKNMRFKPDPRFTYTKPKVKKMKRKRNFSRRQTIVLNINDPFRRRGRR